MTAEEARLEETRSGKRSWRRWGPYVSERQWGTVREDYSANGDAWEYLSHDHARSRAYRWGEDGIAGISDDRQRLCFALALWNGADSFLKERMFGLTGKQGNHGEDVKEYFLYLDNVPSHTYMRYLYKYPQRAFPYVDLVDENRRRRRQDPEYELLDTGIFEDDRYFDVFVEYAKAAPDDILIRIRVANRGIEPALLHLLPTLWFMNDWSWFPGTLTPRIEIERSDAEGAVLRTTHRELEPYWLYCEPAANVLFTENETNVARVYGVPSASPFVKDAFHEFVVQGRVDAVNAARTGWWVNRKDAAGNNIFEGGFLGLDTIGAFDRNSGLPAGGHLEQADGTSWMAMYCLNLFGIALELAKDDAVYEDIATKFFEHFVYIGVAAQKPQPGWSNDRDPVLIEKGRELYAKGDPAAGVIACHICHGPRAEGLADFPRLAGQNAPYIVNQFRAFVSGDRPLGSPMHGIAKDLTPEDAQALAAYLQSL